MVDRFQDDAHHGMAGFFKGCELLFMRAVILAFGTEIDEETVIAVDRDVAERLAVDWNEPLALFAGRFCNQLLGPGAEIRNLPRGQDSDLVAALQARKAHRKPELHAGIFMRR